MPLSLRIILVVVSAMTCVYIARKLKKSQIQITDTIFWIVLAGIFVILAAFPSIATWISMLIGVMSPVNFVYLVIIFLLLIRCFLLSIQVSQLDNKLKSLVEELAIRENENRR
ncbi:MAG: DUF2304 domain-containing protein [Lachnospiraceae bacterium]|nr:DUF2304 domain-containing protein [Lachnospiraceae bacterium]